MGKEALYIQRRTLFVLFVMASLFLSIAWDTDGDPSTDNLPSITFVVEDPEQAEANERVDQPHPTGNPLITRANSSLHRVSAASRAFLACLWRPLTPLARGP